MANEQSDVQIDPETYYLSKIGLLESALTQMTENAAKFSAAMQQALEENERLKRLNEKPSGSEG